MPDRDALRLPGSPDVRNAVLLNESGALLYDLGKLSVRFISGRDAFTHHLILRRLDREKDLCLGAGANPFSAIRHSINGATLSDEERANTELLCREMADRRVSVLSEAMHFQGAWMRPLAVQWKKLSRSARGLDTGEVLACPCVDPDDVSLLYKERYLHN